MPTRTAWWALILLACIVRVAHAPLVSIHQADELWQYLEPARHLTGEDWVRTWEWRAGARSWFLPLLLAIPMKLGMAIAPGTQAHVLLPRLLMVGFSLIPVAGAIRLGARISRRHAILAGFVAAIWFELVYFAPRTLSEPLGVALFLGAAALLLDGRERTRERLAMAGFLLGATVMVRFQLAPAVAVFGLAVAFRGVRAAWPLVAGAIAACLIAGSVDLCAGQTPFLWLWNSFDQNIMANRSAAFGVSGPFGYASELAPVWSWSALVLLPLAIAGARRYPVLMAAAVVNLLVHSLIPHKEYRFILLTTTIFVLLAAIASADLVEWLGRRRAERWHRRAFLALAAGWLLLSAVTAGVLPFRENWGSHGALPRALAMAGQVRDACGLAVVTGSETVTAAWTFYGRRTPIALFHGRTALADARGQAGAFNVMIAPYGSAGLHDPRFRFVGCSEKIRAGGAGPPYCVWRRPGQCTAPVPAEFQPNAVMARLGL